jgi:UDP-sugar transporter A1/2/3
MSIVNSLITLALQNAFLTIIMHYSRISAAPSRTYSAASAVFLNELLKGSISVVIALKRIDVDMLAAPQFQPYSDKDSKDSERRPTPSWSSPFQSSRLQFLSKSVFSPDCYKLSVPAILYVIQNNLQYVAASNLDVATFQVTYQMKILTTAFFSVLLLHKRLTKAKWASLVMLAVGVAIVQLQSVGAPSAKVIAGSESGLNFATKRSSIPEESILASDRVMRPFRGFLAVTLACLTSGLAGVYFEFILKASSGSAPPPDLWVRNTQLSLFSLVPALVPIVFARSGPDGAGWIGRMMASFNNFNGWALGTVLTQTLGGLITAVVIRYSDNIMYVSCASYSYRLHHYRKAFATSLSIIISFLASVALFSYPITLAFVTGSSIVLASTYLYNASSASAASITRNAVGVQPGSPIPTTAPILGEPDRPSRASSVINLLGLGSSSGSSSRQTSSNDLRGQAKHQLSFTQLNPVHHANGFYSASAPGTPYSVSGYPSSTSIYESSRGSPNLSVNIPPGRRSPGESSAGSSGSKSDRPVLSLEIGRETIRGDD